MSIHSPLPILGFSAFSGTGKTTLLRLLIPLLKRKGFRVGMIKHAHHEFDIDHPGKDSYELRKVGAAQMLIASSNRWALVNENQNDQQPCLESLITRLDTNNIDLILVEGFKKQPFPKIELHRPSHNKPLLFPKDQNIIAVASDAPLSIETTLPKLNINDAEAIADFIVTALDSATYKHHMLNGLKAGHTLH